MGIARDEDVKNFRRLYSEAEPMVRAVIYQIHGSTQLDDLVQESFIKIWKGLSSFKGESAIKSWIYRIAVNTALDAARERSRRAENVESDLSHIESGGSSSAQALEARDQVAKALHKLSDDHRAVAVLALIHERPLEEIAEALSVSLGTVKSRLHYAKENLREFLEVG